MKEYEKWFDADKLIGKLYENYISNMCTGLTWDTIVKVSEYTWKAALEWALKKLEEQYERLAPGDSGWEGKFIENELKENDWLECLEIRMIDIYCACNKRKCEGLCREYHLFRKRQQFDTCPAACKRNDSTNRLENFTEKDLKEIK